MSPLLSLLRCPIDPARKTCLERVDQHLVCKQCNVRFPIRQGHPILLYREAELPEGVFDVSDLPCVKIVRKDRKSKRSR